MVSLSDNGKFDDRRDAVRLAGGSAVDATVLDEHGQPVRILEDARVLDLGAGGIALTTTTPTEAGRRVQVTVDSASGDGKMQLEFESLECLDYAGGRHKLRCRLIEGQMPARLIHGW